MAIEDTVEAIVIAYVDALGEGGDVVAEDLTALLEADDDIGSVDLLQFSRQDQSLWSENPPSITTLKMFSMETATTQVADIDMVVQVDVYINVTWDDTWSAQDILDGEALLIAYVTSLEIGEDVAIQECSDLAESINTILGVSIGRSLGTLDTIDLVIDSDETAITDATIIDITSGGG